MVRLEPETAGLQGRVLAWPAMPKSLVSVDFFTVPSIRFWFFTCSWSWLTIGAGFCISTSPPIPRLSGQLSNFEKPPRLIRSHGTCCAIATASSGKTPENK